MRWSAVTHGTGLFLVVLPCLYRYIALLLPSFFGKQPMGVVRIKVGQGIAHDILSYVWIWCVM